jgi:hypothetical protein
MHPMPWTMAHRFIWSRPHWAVARWPADRDKAFYRAEDYHQDYAYYNPDNPYIQVCDRPTIAALRKQFPELFVEYKPKK